MGKKWDRGWDDPHILNMSMLISVQHEVVLQRASVEKANHLDATTAAPFAPPRRSREQTTTPAHPSAQIHRGSRRSGRHGRSHLCPLAAAGSPGPDARAAPCQPPRPANLLSLAHLAAAGNRRRNCRAAPRPPRRPVILRPSVEGHDATPERRLVWEPTTELPAVPRRLALLPGRPFHPTPPGTLGSSRKSDCLRRIGSKMQKHPHKKKYTCQHPTWGKQL
jgi:hypothetical protein